MLLEVLNNEVNEVVLKGVLNLPFKELFKLNLLSSEPCIFDIPVTGL
jgi:hypothetical protein